MKRVFKFLVVLLVCTLGMIVGVLAFYFLASRDEEKLVLHENLRQLTTLEDIEKFDATLEITEKSELFFGEYFTQEPKAIEKLASYSLNLENRKVTLASEDSQMLNLPVQEYIALNSFGKFETWQKYINSGLVEVDEKDKRTTYIFKDSVANEIVKEAIIDEMEFLLNQQQTDTIRFENINSEFEGFFEIKIEVGEDNVLDLIEVSTTDPIKYNFLLKYSGSDIPAGEPNQYESYYQINSLKLVYHFSSIDFSEGRSIALNPIVLFINERYHKDLSIMRDFRIAL